MVTVYKTPWCAKCQDRPRAPSSAYCRECRNEYQSAYKRRRYAPDLAYRARAVSYVRKKLYGISEERYTELWAQQGGVCAICLQDDEAKGLGVDHDHETGEVRGLLCTNCNTALGLLRDRPFLLSRAKEYLA